jgi:DNA processing protein
MRAYPKLLHAVYSKPAVLYVKGDLGCLDGALAVAMVGSRKHSEYGREAAARFAGELAKEGAVVVSGLAPGIDTESHLAALAAGGKTVGVLGCGLDVDYPRDSRELKTAVSKNGAVVTEYPLGTEPFQGNFPMRNRIISGMSHGVLVVEAGVRSGSLITARLAKEQGRDVFAVPGSIFVVGEQGTHKLIKEGARLADSAEDILGQYAGLIRKRAKKGEPVVMKGKRKPIANDDPANKIVAEQTAQPETNKPPAPAKLPDGTSELTARVYAAFGAERMTVDELAAKTALTAGELLAALTELEIYGLVVCHPGRRFGRS